MAGSPANRALPVGWLPIYRMAPVGLHVDWPRVRGVGRFTDLVQCAVA